MKNNLFNKENALINKIVKSKFLKVIKIFEN